MLLISYKLNKWDYCCYQTGTYSIITRILNDCQFFSPQSNPLILLMVNSLGNFRFDELIIISWNNTQFSLCLSLSLKNISHVYGVIKRNITDITLQWTWSGEGQNWACSNPLLLRNKQTTLKVVIRLWSYKNLGTCLTLPTLLSPLLFSQCTQVFRSRV